jgi:hypothetical protein
VGGLAHDVGTGLGDVGSALWSIPNDAAAMATGIIPGIAKMYEDPQGVLKAMPGAIANDFSLHNIAHHPLYPLVDLSTLLSAGAAGGARVAEAARVARGVSELGPSESAIEAGMQPWSPARQMRHAIMFGSPKTSRLIVGLPKDEAGNLIPRGPEGEIPKGSVIAKGTYFTRNPLYAQGQALIDQFHETHPDLAIPGLGRVMPMTFGKQAARINKAQFAFQLTEKGLSRFEANQLISRYAKMPLDQQEAVRAVLTLTDPAKTLEFLNEQTPKLHGSELKRHLAWIDRVENSQKYIDMQDVTTPPTMHVPEEGETVSRVTQAGESKPFSVSPTFARFHLGNTPDLAPFATLSKARAQINLDAQRFDELRAAAERASRSGDKSIRGSALRTIRQLDKQGRPLEEVTSEVPAETYMEHPGGTYSVPSIKPEFKKVQDMVDQVRRVSDLRTEALHSAGYLDRMSSITRALGPYNIVNGHGIVPNLKEMKSALQTAVNFGHAEREAHLRSEIAHWESVLKGGAGDTWSEEMKLGKPAPIMDPALAAMAARIPETLSTKTMVDQFMRPWKVGRVPLPPSLTHAYQGIMLRHGGGNPNIARAVAESYQEATRFMYLTRLRKRIIEAAQDTPAGIPADHMLPIIMDYWKGKFPPGFNFPKKLLEEGPDSPEEAQAGSMWFEPVRQLLASKTAAVAWANTNPQALRWAQQNGFTGMTLKDLENARLPGVKWIDNRWLGGLDKQNPLWSAFESPGARLLARGVDTLNEIQKAVLLYLKPAYIIPNALGNVALTLIHQGFLAPKNLTRSFKILFTGKGLDEHTFQVIKSMMGSGMTGVLKEQKTMWDVATAAGNRAAEFYGKFVDDPFRFSAFLHEADVAGFRSAEELRKLATDPRLESELQDIANRANDAIINYERLGPGEQAILRRVVFFYPWVKGSTRYAGQFIINHPVAAGASAQLGRVGNQWDEQVLGPMPSYLEGLIPLEGGRRVMNPASAAILQQPADILKEIMNPFNSNPNPDLSFMSNLTPVGSFLYTGLTGHTTMPYRASTPWTTRALNEAFGGWPIMNFINHVTGNYQARPNSIYGNEDFWTALNRFVGLGGMSPRNFNKVKANYNAWQQAHPTGFQT